MLSGQLAEVVRSSSFLLLRAWQRQACLDDFAVSQLNFGITASARGAIQAFESRVYP